MILNQIKNESNYSYLERYVNNFKKVANEVSPAFCAVQGQPYFFLPEIELSLKKVKVFLANPDKLIKRKIIYNGKVRFFNMNNERYKDVELIVSKIEKELARKV